MKMSVSHVEAELKTLTLPFAHIQCSRVLGLQILSELSSNSTAIFADVQPNRMHARRLLSDSGR